MSKPNFKVFEQSTFAEQLKAALGGNGILVSEEQARLVCSALFSSHPEQSWVQRVNQKIIDYIDTHQDTCLYEVYWDYYSDKQLLGLAFSSGIRNGGFALYFPQSSEDNDEIWPPNIETKGGFNADDLNLIREIMSMIPKNHQELAFLKVEAVQELFIDNEEGAATSIVVVYEKNSQE